MKLYQYTILKTDGTKEVLKPSKKKDFKGEGGLYELLHCQTIEIIPTDYFPDWMNKRAMVFGDEEGRLIAHPIRNPHMKVLDGRLGLQDAYEGAEWDCVGDLILEEVYHGQDA